MSFAPFIDASRIDDATVRKAHRLAVRANDAYKAFMADPTPETYAAYLDVQDDFNGACMESAARALVTPMMVHVAGMPSWEDDDTAPEGRACRQRCAKCGSELMSFVPGAALIQTAMGIRPLVLEDYTWYPGGLRVGKVVSPNEEMGGTVPIEPADRDLQPHEHECIGGDQLTTIDDIKDIPDA